jgi:hypothetical protein
MRSSRLGRGGLRTAAKQQVPDNVNYFWSFDSRIFWDGVAVPKCGSAQSSRP